MYANGSQSQFAGRVRTLLLVEDAEDDARMAIRALDKLGLNLEVRWAKDGNEALTALGLTEASQPTEPVPDLVICDIKMPKISGIEVLGKIRNSERLSALPVVMFSTSTHHWDVNRCMELGANDYCFKPFDIEEFGECVRGIARRWLAPEHSDSAPGCLVESSSES